MTFMLHETLLFGSGGPGNGVKKDLQRALLLTKNEWHNQLAMLVMSVSGENRYTIIAFFTWKNET